MNSTYRIQLNDQFTFLHLKGIIDYLHQLGISTIYASPVTTAIKGSSHGYDVTNPLILNPEIGTEDEWRQLTVTLKEYGMAWLQDIVPNHMAYDNNNPWLSDVLQRGKDSPYHSFFDFFDPPFEPGYRRFFTLNSLICLQMENEAVFTAYHERIHYWFRQGWIQGLRIDHIDGLADPKGYIRRLQHLFGKDCYIVAEKILTGDETLPGDWDIAGTTGYDFLSMAGQLLTDSDGSRLLRDFYQEKVIALPNYPDIVFDRKYKFLRTYMAGELDYLMDQLTGESFFTSAGDTARLKEALATLMASFPVYRAYPGDGPLAESDWLIINAAVQRAKQLRPEYRPELSCLESFMRHPTAFRSRLMQFTGPLAAKGIEDTTFYVYNPYIALNEVGDSPGKAGLPIEAFHRKMQYRQANSPLTLNATSTHDTKRGEDSRIRLSLLSCKPMEWIDAVMNWRDINHALIANVNGRPAPSSNDEYLIYQALLGGFPEDFTVTDNFRERFAGYLTKALREAKTETNYDHPDEQYEKSCQTFATAILQKNSPFLHDFIPFAVTIIRQSYVYSLSMLLIKLTAPGIPDIYQGAELWELSFVDPDNRRPVDYARRAGLLQQIITEEAKDAGMVLRFLHAHREKGAQKLFTIYRTLHFRKHYPRLFSAGEYIPVAVKGPVLAYIRRLDPDWILVLVPLIRYNDPLPASLSVSLPTQAPSIWTHLFTGDTFSAGDSLLECKDIWDRWPVALLHGTSV